MNKIIYSLAFLFIVFTVNAGMRIDGVINTIVPSITAVTGTFTTSITGGAITGTTLGLTGALTSVGSGGVSVTTATTSTSALRFRGFIDTLSTHTLTYGDVWGQVSDNTLWMSTRTVVISDNDPTCAGTICYIQLSN